MKKNYVSDYFPTCEDVVVPKKDIASHKKTFASTFRQLCDDNEVNPYKLGKEVTAFLGSMLEGKPKPSEDIVKITLNMVKSYMSENLPSDPMMADFLKGALFEKISKSKSFNALLSGMLANG